MCVCMGGVCVLVGIGVLGGCKRSRPRKIKAECNTASSLRPPRGWLLTHGVALF